MKDLVACDTNRQNRNYENIELWINDEVRASQRSLACANMARNSKNRLKNSSPRRVNSSHSSKASTVLPMCSEMLPR